MKSFRTHILMFFYNVFMKNTLILRLQFLRLIPIMIAAQALQFGCKNDPLQHACPTNMHRGENFICVPNQEESNESTTDDTSTEKSTAGTDSKSAKTCPKASPTVHLHEVLIDPDGPDKGREWIELLIETAGALDGMQLIIRKTAVDAPSVTIDLHGNVAADDLVLIADDQPQSIAFGCETYGGCLQNSGGVLELYDCQGALQDTLQWGYASASNVQAPSGYSLSWCDTQSTWAASTPSPGGRDITWRSPETCKAPCDAPQHVRINEVLYDLVGADNGGEFIELIADPHTDLTGITVWAINGADGEPFLKPIPLTGSTDERGYYLIAGTDISQRDDTLPGQLQNGPEAIYLEGCDGSMIDAITYGGDADTLLAYGGSSPILPPGQSLGRRPGDALDAHDMRLFTANEPTPKGPNIVVTPLEDVP